MWRLILVLTLSVNVCVPQIQHFYDVTYQIAGIFVENALTQKLAFNESARHAQVNRKRLAPIILEPAKPNTYTAWKELCSNPNMRPVAVLGPQHILADGAIKNQCIKAHIPHIQATWQPNTPDYDLTIETESDEDLEEVTTEANVELEFKNISINFYPDSNEIFRAYATLLKHYQWDSFAVMYEDDYGLMRVQKILAEYTDQFPVFIRKLNPDGENHKIFKEVMDSKESRIVLDCHVDRVESYMKIANDLDMTNYYQHYILTSFDTSTIAEKLLKYNSNITWLSLAEYDQLQGAQHFLAQRVSRWNLNGGTPPVTQFETEALIMDDIANHLLEAFQTLENTNGITNVPNPYNSICESELTAWSHGALFQNAILQTQTKGVTGNVQFDEFGRRINYTLFVNEIYVNKRATIGRWESTQSDEIVQNNEGNGESSLKDNKGFKHFIVISRKARPYFDDKAPCAEEDETCDPNDKYEGFSVDVIKAIFEKLQEENYNYTYQFHYEEDLSYGTFDEETRKWTGMIGYLLEKKADLAICDLTITEERKKVVDFSVPIMHLGISILYAKEVKVPPSWFSFLHPYSFEVWIYIATAYCVVSILLFVCARISPGDWENPQPCDKDPEELENIWNFKNCTWLTAGSIMCQGCDILPKALGTRFICGMWWFFAVIVCQTYIAQLSASMTSALQLEPINSVEDLAKQNKIIYGALKGGTTLEFFKTSKYKIYQTIYQNMASQPAVLVASNDEGEKRVDNGNNKYAFFMESTSIEYKVMRNCNLKEVGTQLDSKDYGIAMPANSPFRLQINRALLKLKESSTLTKIKDLWWKEKYIVSNCQTTVDTNDTEGDMEMENLIGLFLVLILGLVFSVIITAAEFMNEVRNIVVREQVTHKEAFIKELRASLNFFQLQKPVLRNPSRAPSIAGSENSNASVVEKQNRRAAVLENFLDFEKITQ